jgi:microcystin-dependent protein
MANLKIKEGLSSKTYGENILPKTGTILTYAGSTAPAGWLLCNGSTFSSAQYPELYVLLGLSNTLPDLREKYLIGKGSGSLTLNSNTGANNHTHTYSYAGNTSGANAAANHNHTVGTYFNATYTAHAHYSYLNVGIDGYGNSAANYRAGGSQNMTTQNHAHSTGGYASGSNYAGYNHAHNGSITRNDASAPTHTHTVASSGTGTMSSNVAINTPPTIYLNFIIKAG